MWTTVYIWVDGIHVSIRLEGHKLCLLADTGGWEAEFGRDVWQMRLGFTGSQRLTFPRIPQS